MPYRHASCYLTMITIYSLPRRRDPALDALLDLDGQILVVDPAGHWVSFVVTQVPPSAEKPHGLDYSLVLHGPDGRRLAGLDNAHPPAGRRGGPQDHRHRFATVKAYAYTNAATLLGDFWDMVDSILCERGAIP